MTLTSPFVSAACALLPALFLVGITLYRQKRLERTNAGALFVALSSGFAIPKGLFLCNYLFAPDDPNIPTKLHGYEKEIFAAGAIVVFLAMASIWSLCEEAARKPSTTPAIVPTSPPTP